MTMPNVAPTFHNWRSGWSTMDTRLPVEAGFYPSDPCMPAAGTWVATSIRSTFRSEDP
jgi:hypothetical protein